MDATTKLITVMIAAASVTTATAQNTEADDSLERQLQEVVVEARQPATKLVGTTLVSTIAGSNLSDLGTALDVLGQLPMIMVQDNSVSVTGKSAIEIYIDGRPMRDEYELQQILSSNIKTVELLMAPGAAYDSTTDAVLRITTRRNFVQGLSLTDIFELQNRRRLSVMDYLNLSYRTGGWEIFANGTFNRNNTVTHGTTTNTLTYNGCLTTVGSSQHNASPATVGVVKAGFSYVKDTQSFGAYYRYNPERGHFANTGTEWLDDTPAITRDIDKRIRSHSHLVSLYYENRFADRYLLHFDGDYRRSADNNGVDTSYPGSEIQTVSSSDSRHSSLWAGKLYINMPLWRGDFTIGTQGSHTRTTLDYVMHNTQVGQYIPSSYTDARQTSAALFATWARTFGRFSLSAGARYEYVDYDFSTDGVRDDDISRRDHLLTPDISLGYTFSDAQLGLSYKMATVRPPYSQLTGSLSYTGMHEIEGGNPALRDEHMHDLQLFGAWNGFILQADYIRGLDTYAYVKERYPAADLQLLMHPVNIDVSALSMYIVWNKSIGRWTTDITGGMYRQWLTLDGTRHDRPIFSYYIDNTLALPHGWAVTANVSGRSAGDMHTNRFGATPFTMDASVGKTLLDKSLTIKLSATDIFNTANNGWTMDTYGIHVDKRQRYDYRGITLSITYTLHPRGSRYKGAPASDAELNRL